MLKCRIKSFQNVIRHHYLFNIGLTASWSSTRANKRYHMCVRATPSTNTGWTEKEFRTVLRRKTWGCWRMRSLTPPVRTSLQPRKPTILNQKKSGQCVDGSDSAPLIHCCETHQKCCIQFRATSIRKTLISWSESRGWPKRWSESQNTFPVKTGWKSWGSLAWRRKTLLQLSSTQQGPTRNPERDCWQGHTGIGQGAMFYTWKRLDLD